VVEPTWPLLRDRGDGLFVAGPESPAATRALAVVAASAAVALAYALAGAIGVMLLHGILAPDLATFAPTLGVPWLAVGIAVAGLMLLGKRAAPGVLVGSYVTWGVFQDDPALPVLIDALGETASVALIVWLLRIWDYRPSLTRYQDALILVAAAALGRLVSAGVDVLATFATAWLMSTPTTRVLLEEAGVYREGNVFLVFPSLFVTNLRWWANSVCGIVLVVPLLAPFAAADGRRRAGGRGELVLWAALTAGWLVVAIAVPGPAPRIALLALLALALVLVVWAASRFGVAFASAGTLAFSMAATVGFGLQLGAFAGIGGREGVEVVWGFIGLLAGSGLFLTPLLGGRARAQLRLGASVERYRRLFLANPSPMWAEDFDTGRILIVNDAAVRAYGYSEDAFLKLHSRELKARGADGEAAADDRDSTRQRAHETTHRTASGGELEVEVTPIRIELDGTALRVCFIDVLAERNDLRLAVLSAADLERHRLGQEIRDGLGPVLARLGARIEELVVATNCNEPVDPALARSIEADAVVASAQCRQLTRGASPMQFASGNLLEALRRIPEVLAAEDGAEVTVSVQSRGPLSLSLERCEHIYRITHDAVRAALLRPGIGRVHVTVDVTADDLVVTVDDDGVAVEAPEQRDRPDIWPMDVRAAAARAQLERSERRGGGNRVRCECRQADDHARETPVVQPAESSAGAVLRPLAPAEAAVRPARIGASIRTWLDGAWLLFAYVVTGAAGLRFLQYVDARHVAMLPAAAIPWIASGVGVAGLLLGGERLAPAVFLGSITVWRGLAHDPWITTLADALGETLSAVIVVRLLGRWGFRRTFDRFRDLAVLVGVAALGRLIPAVFDAVGLHITAALAPGTLTPELIEGLAPGAGRVAGMTRVELAGYALWWINGVTGITLLVPAVVPEFTQLRRKLAANWGEASLFSVALGLAAVAIAGGPPASWRLALLGLGVVLVAWAALRFGVALACAATLLLSLATGLFLTTVVAEHEATMGGLKGLRARYEALFEAIPRPVFAFSQPAERITMVNAEAIRKYGYERGELLAMAPTALLADPAAPLRVGATAAVDRAVQSRVNRARSGATFEVEMSLTRVDLGDEVEQLCFAIDVTERNDLRRRVLEASDLEQRRLAGELHDGLGQSLTGLHLGSASVRRTLERDGHAKMEAVLFMAGAIRGAIDACEQIVQGLSPLHATGGDLLAALKHLPTQLPPAHREKLSVEVRARSALRLPLPMREHLYQIARESMNNALKHAGAEHITVTLTVEPGSISLIVEDDGIGFDPSARRVSGLGLRSLALRASALRGRLSVQRRPVRGIAVICRCPQAVLQ
jgi:PAS domain S-box-containing protein